LVQARIVTENVRVMADFYARLVRVSVVLNDYYVEVPTGTASIGFSKCRFTEYRHPGPPSDGLSESREHIVLDFVVDDVDREFDRIDGLGVEWVLWPTTQPWGSRSMVFRDPEGNLVNVFSRPDGVNQ
jgi:catechol 2,3-dioxygenase-like lactoylglutathione lyase family enzyme